jgi:hypothetical protein
LYRFAELFDSIQHSIEHKYRASGFVFRDSDSSQRHVRAQLSLDDEPVEPNRGLD